MSFVSTIFWILACVLCFIIGKYRDLTTRVAREISKEVKKVPSVAKADIPDNTPKNLRDIDGGVNYYG